MTGGWSVVTMNTADCPVTVVTSSIDHHAAGTGGYIPEIVTVFIKIRQKRCKIL